jgi:uncharacterized protein YggE
VAIIGAGGSPASDLNVSVQEQGPDPSQAVNGAQTKAAAVVAALEKAGVPESNIRLSNLYSYINPQTKQFSAYTTIQAQLSGADQVTAAAKAVLQIEGVTGYSTGPSFGVQPKPAEVQGAVAEAAAQAKSMAAITASTAGVSLGAVESIVVQPPMACYGLGGPTRTVGVTVTYAIK